MKCNCKKEAENKLQIRTGDDKGYFDAVISFDDFKEYLVLAFFYRKKKRDGSFQERKTKISVACSFCPFCGASLKKGNSK